MALHLITGHSGAEHVTADNAGHLNAQILGAENFIFGYGEKFRYNLNSNNQVRVYDGMGIMNGRQFELPAGTYQDMTIENGEQSMFRNDLIVARYTINANTGIETISLIVVKGESNENEGIDPEINEGNILLGDTIVDFPLYRVKLSGLSVTDVEQLFKINNSLIDSLGHVVTAGDPIGFTPPLPVNADMLGGRPANDYALNENLTKLEQSIYPTYNRELATVETLTTNKSKDFIIPTDGFYSILKSDHETTSRVLVNDNVMMYQGSIIALPMKAGTKLTFTTTTVNNVSFTVYKW